MKALMRILLSASNATANLDTAGNFVNLVIHLLDFQALTLMTKLKFFSRKPVLAQPMQKQWSL